MDPEGTSRISHQTSLTIGVDHLTVASAGIGLTIPDDGHHLMTSERGGEGLMRLGEIPTHTAGLLLLLLKKSLTEIHGWWASLLLGQWTEEKSTSTLTSKDHFLQHLLTLKKALLHIIIVKGLVRNFMTPGVNHSHLREECLNKSSLLPVAVDPMSSLTNIMGSSVNLLIHRKAGHLSVSFTRVSPLLPPHLPHNHCH